MSGIPIISEQEVLKQLDIPDFRHLSKEKVMSFASMLPCMDKATAQKALEQFPDFAKTVQLIVHEYGDFVKGALHSNDESTTNSYSTAVFVISILQKQLEVDGLTFDQRMQIMKLLFELQHLVAAKDSENKQFHRDALISVGLVFISGLVFATSVLGGNINFRLPIAKK